MKKPKIPSSTPARLSPAADQNPYKDQRVFQAESEKLFNSSWIYLGTSERLTPGSTQTFDLSGRSVLVTRTENGQLLGFHNLCPHRGAEILAPGCQPTQKKLLTCQYHGWTYDLSGKLKAVPRRKLPAECDIHLKPIQVATLGPFLFGNLDPLSPSFETTFSPIEQILKEHRIDLSQLKFRERRTFEIHANWKVVVENYLECYHCPVAHKSFSGLIDVEDYSTTTYSNFSLQKGAKNKKTPPTQGTLFAANTNATTETTSGLYFYLFPTFMLNTYPGEQNASLNLMIPISEEKTLAIFDLYLAESISEEAGKKIFDFIEEVQREDEVLCQSVQRGMASGSFTRAHLLLPEEVGIDHFQTLYQNAFSSQSRIDKLPNPNLFDMTSSAVV